MDYQDVGTRPSKRNRQHSPPLSTSSSLPPLLSISTKLPSASSPNSWPRFIILTTTPSDQSLKTTSPFTLSKALHGLIGTPRNIKRLRSGDVLVECISPSQSNQLLGTSTLGNTGISISPSPHRSLNSSKGVIRCPDLKDMSSDEILAELKPQGVSEVRRLTLTRPDGPLQTNTYFLTFNSPNPPSYIQAGYLQISVSPYIPNPLRCYKCQRYGHGKNFCRSQERCSNCGDLNHSQTECKSDSFCIICSGPHPANSKDCPQWKKEKEIIKIKFTQKITYPEAKKIAENNNHKSNTPTFAQIVNSSNPTVFQANQPQTNRLQNNQPQIIRPQTNQTRVNQPQANQSQSSQPQPQLPTKPSTSTQATQTNITWVTDYRESELDPTPHATPPPSALSTSSFTQTVKERNLFKTITTNLRTSIRNTASGKIDPPVSPPPPDPHPNLSNMEIDFSPTHSNNTDLTPQLKPPDSNSGTRTKNKQKAAQQIEPPSLK